MASTFRVVTSSQSSWKLWRRGSCKDERDETTHLSLLGLIISHTRPDLCEVGDAVMGDAGDAGDAPFVHVHSKRLLESILKKARIPCAVISGSKHKFDRSSRFSRVALPQPVSCSKTACRFANSCVNLITESNYLFLFVTSKSFRSRRLGQAF